MSIKSGMRIDLILLACLFLQFRQTYSYLPSAEIESPASAINLKLSEPNGCPAEFFSNIRTIPEKLFYVTGQRLTLDCRTEEVQRQLMASLPDNQTLRDYKLLVYPANYRTCLKNGTWSSKPQVCSWIPTGSAPAIDFSIAAYTEIYDCSLGSCAGVKADAWVDVGLIDPRSCPINIQSTYGNDESRKILYVFARHVYLNFIFIPPSGALKNVKVSVKKQDVIHEFSETSRQLLSGHYDIFRRVNKTEGCAVTRLPVFAREILIEYQFDAKQQALLPDVEFFTIPEPGNSRRGAWNGLGCPKEPLILHSKKTKEERRGSQTNVTYTCKPGYLMMDPITQTPSDGVLRCHNNFEWQPYPFPVCQEVLIGDSRPNVQRADDDFNIENPSSAKREVGQVDEEIFRDPEKTKSLRQISRYHSDEELAQVDHGDSEYIENNADSPDDSSKAIGAINNEFAITDSVSESPGDYPSVTEGRTWQIALSILALVVGIVVGVAFIAVWRLKKSNRKRSKTQAREIEKRHGTKNQQFQCQLDTGGYLVPIMGSSICRTAARPNVELLIEHSASEKTKSFYTRQTNIPPITLRTKANNDYATPVDRRHVSFDSNGTATETSSDFYCKIDKDPVSKGTSSSTAAYQPLSEDCDADDDDCERNAGLQFKPIYNFIN